MKAAIKCQRTASRWLVGLMAMVGVTFATGCSATPNPSNDSSPVVNAHEPPAITPPLIGTNWRCNRIGSRLLADEAAPTLLVATDGNASGFAGVNRWFGPCKQDGPTLKFGMVAMTRMAGPPERMELERTYADALRTVTSWCVMNGRLQLLDGTSVVLEFQPAQ